MQRILLFFVLSLIAFHSFAQKDQRLTRGLSPVENLPILQMPHQDNQVLMSNELARRGPGVAPRYATNIAVDITPATHGQWETTPYGSVWRLRIKSQGAYSLNFGFTQYTMPRGGKLVMYSPDQARIQGPFTPADNEEHEQLWTPLIEGDELVIEVTVPTASINELSLKLAYVNHAFENFSALISGSCNLDVICGAADGWGIVDPHRDIIQSVAVISTGGGTFCTGFLVNNVENDCTPFFMTANHCGINSGNAPSLVTYWNYQNSTCRQPNTPASGGPGDGQLNDFNTGAIFRASRSQSDFVLVELDDPVSPTANAYFAGWDARGVSISSAIGIHHPRTDEKRISFENDPTQFTTYGSSTPTSNYTHVRVVDWDTGTTEGGSSGSPLFDQNERVVGQLHGGGAACGNNLSDWYGSFAISWDAGGSASSRLRDWLDPNNTGTEFINGRWANDCSFTVSGTPVEQTICQPDVAFYDITASTGFSGSASLSLAGLPFGTYDFSPSSIDPGETSTLSVETSNLDPGTYNFTVTASNNGDDIDIDLTLIVLAGSTDPPTLLDPADNSTDIFPNPILVWDGDDSGATTYTVQISTNSNFTNIVETGSTTATTYQPTNANQGATQYYWRVRASNDCGTTGYSDIFSFVTQNISCVTYNSDFSTTISANGTPSIENDIFFAEDFTIASVVIGLEITHSYIGDLSAQLLPVSGGAINLFNRPGFPNDNFGCSEDNLHLFFSDDSPNSPSALENTCNPSDTGPNNPGPPYAIEGSFQPIGNFNGFIGQSSFGTWTLQVNDNASADGGILEEWFVTVCYAVPSEPPVLVTNQTLQVIHNTQETITNTYLEAEDQGSGPDEIYYTITDLPNQGVLLLNGQVLNLGDSFTQEDIDNGLVAYEHGGGTVLSDNFEFDLSNAAGISTTGNVFFIEIIINPLMASITQTGNILCNGDANGAVSAFATGGVAPYQYALNGGDLQADNNFTDLAAGNYFVTIVDMLGTEISTNTITIGQPTQVTATTNVSDDQITVNAAGGTPGYTYQLENGTPQSSNIFSNVPNGTYTITVTDANGCSAAVTATVAVNNIILTAALVQDISCHDADDAIITALASGGTPAYQYRINGGSFQLESTFTNLGPGAYTIEVQDQDGFTQSSVTINVTNPPLLSLSASVVEDEVTANAAGGTPPLRYQLDGGSPQSSPVFSGLDNGNYSITVIDDNDCTATVSVTVAVNTLVVSATLVNDITCNNANDGSLQVNVSGGTPGFLYSLDGGTYQSSPIFNGLAAGGYTVTVLDSEGFTQTTNSITITNPAAINATAMVTDNVITVNATGGTGQLLYQLNNGTLQSNPVFTNVPNGQYTITVYDANDCTTTLSATVAVNTLVVNATLVSDITCNNANDGSLQVSVSGGTPAFMYSIDGENYQSSPIFSGLAGGSYTVTVLDSEGFTQTTNSITITNPAAINATAMVTDDVITINATGGTGQLLYQLNNGTLQSNPVFTNVPNGQYTITVYDANDCTTSLSATVAVNTLVVSATLVSDITCNNANDGSLQVSVSGGTPAFMYSLDGENYQSSPIFSGLAAGSYTVTVLDSEGFTQTTNSITITNPAAINATAMVTDDVITVNATGGTGQLLYQLNNGTLQSNPVFTNVPNGQYNITVYDANDCTTSLSATVAVNTLVVNAILIRNMSCHNVNDGRLMAEVQGGTPPFQYSLDGENYQNEALFTGLSAGTYTVTVLDAEGFTQTTNSITITNPTVVSMMVMVDGSTITVTASGGTGTLMYSINGQDFQTENSFTNVPDGIYQVSVRDENGCAVAMQAIVAVNGLLASVQVVNQVACFGDADGSLVVTASGGIAPYQYSLDGETFTEENTFGNLPAGDYQVTVADAAGAMFTTNIVTIEEPSALNLVLSVMTDNINAEVTGGTAPYEYSLNGGDFQTSSIFPDLPPGDYQVTVLDANDCATEGFISILVGVFTAADPSLNLQVYPNPNTGQFDLLLAQATGNKLTCKVFNSAGALVAHELLAKPGFELRHSFDLQFLPPGLYQLVLFDADAFGTVRVMVVR
ncbi:cadherin-like domain-containing protein [Lewinella sp. LCG006]|uniref:cadherin-like domain-containing protein n=1 Tax=Lewinella sp. LCG006 TaxID=3231911 RepID=UPI00345FEC8F